MREPSDWIMLGYNDLTIKKVQVFVLCKADVLAKLDINGYFKGFEVEIIQILRGVLFLYWLKNLYIFCIHSCLY